MIWYEDPNMRSHWTSICAYHIYGMPLAEWSFCAKGNSVDHEEQKNPN